MGLFGPGSAQSVLLVCKLRLNPSSWVLTESLEKSPVVSLKVTVSIEFFPLSLFLQLSTFTSLSSKAAGRWFNFTPSICHFLSETSQPSCPPDVTASACRGALSHLPAVCSSADPAGAIFIFFFLFVLRGKCSKAKNAPSNEMQI